MSKRIFILVIVLSVSCKYIIMLGILCIDEKLRESCQVPCYSLASITTYTFC